MQEGKANPQIEAVGELENPSFLIDHSLEIISNLSDFWVSGDYDHKRKLQEALFPGGVLFDRQVNNLSNSSGQLDPYPNTFALNDEIKRANQNFF